MKLRDFLARAFAILLIGSLACPPLAVSAAGTGDAADAQAMASDDMTSDIAMDSTAAAPDEMPCHKNVPDHRNACPFMAICMALCCQGIPISAVSLALPVVAASRMLPPQLVQLDGVISQPPSRPPKA
jgi:hypothetical protein